MIGPYPESIFVKDDKDDTEEKIEENKSENRHIRGEHFREQLFPEALEKWKESHRRDNDDPMLYACSHVVGSDLRHSTDPLVYTHVVITTTGTSSTIQESLCVALLQARC